MTVANFVGLAEGTITNQAYAEGIPYFDGSIFHRVVPGHVIQAGAPAKEGISSPGYTIPNEIHSALSHGQPGILGMANGGPHTNGSQFYITLGDRSYLDGDYTVFGRVQEGMEVVDAIVQGDIIQHIRIVRIGKNAKRFRTDEASFRTRIAEVQANVEAEAKEKAQVEAMYIRIHWSDTLTTEEGWRYKIVKAGHGQLPKERELCSRFSIRDRRSPALNFTVPMTGENHAHNLPLNLFPTHWEKAGSFQESIRHFVK